MHSAERARESSSSESSVWVRGPYEMLSFSQVTLVLQGNDKLLLQQGPIGEIGAELAESICEGGHSSSKCSPTGHLLFVLINIHQSHASFRDPSGEHLVMRKAMNY
ncbi:Hypothetical protein NTJ_15397 [Nesidiocoris tenuis]|uniref:Uncharacterized protein n=1 Tax=Nesidiocoris tenuis TaxID=355587 RepID=A0ABN7BE82_9HEMI|nr:Hypothetical protein NTJ_15397 [Nesidiocoris tenuis]